MKLFESRVTTESESVSLLYAEREPQQTDSELMMVAPSRFGDVSLKLRTEDHWLRNVRGGLLNIKRFSSGVNVRTVTIGVVDNGGNCVPHNLREIVYSALGAGALIDPSAKSYVDALTSISAKERGLSNRNKTLGNEFNIFE